MHSQAVQQPAVARATDLAHDAARCARAQHERAAGSKEEVEEEGKGEGGQNMGSDGPSSSVLPQTITWIQLNPDSTKRMAQAVWMEQHGHMGAAVAHTREITAMMTACLVHCSHSLADKES